MSGNLGFGMMRLPRRGLAIDVKQTSEMVDVFLDAGFTYFDTAFIYPGSEDATRRALVERYPRERYTLATKLFAAIAPSEKAAKKELETSLQRTGAGYIDYYLLHSLMEANYRKYERFHLWEFAEEEKRRGRLRHIGFSFHGGPALLETLLTEHPDVDFVQLQINYADWENPRIQSRKLYEIARSHGKQIVIMEPVKGGKLANPPAEVRRRFDAVDPGASYASWAIRFAASLDGILAVLSGMSSVEQVRDNTAFMKAFQPLNEEEMEAVRAAQKIFNESVEIPCTACGYCTGGCPKHIPIPDIFAILNRRTTTGRLEQAAEEYAALTGAGSGAADCVGCKRCEAACPQHLPITELLRQCADALG